MGAFAIPGIISGVGSLIGGILGSNAAQTAASDQSQAVNKGLATQQQVYNTDSTAVQPYQAAGSAALSQLGAGTAAGGQFNSTPTSAQVMAEDPGYQFNLDQGQQAVQRAAAAGGGAASGGALKAASQYATNYTTNAYANAYQQFMNTRQSNYGNLSNLAGMGMQANNQLIGAGQNFANQSSNLYVDQGNALAAGAMGSANAWSGALSGIGTAAQGAYAMAPRSTGSTASTYNGNFASMPTAAAAGAASLNNMESGWLGQQLASYPTTASTYANANANSDNGNSNDTHYGQSYGN